MIDNRTGVSRDDEKVELTEEGETREKRSLTRHVRRLRRAGDTAAMVARSARRACSGEDSAHATDHLSIVMTEKLSVQLGTSEVAHLLRRG